MLPGIGCATSGVIIVAGSAGTVGYSGDDVLATASSLNHPQSMAADAAGNIYIADTSNHRIRKVAAGTGIITTVAGTGTIGSAGDTGAATSAQLNYPYGVALDSAGNIYIADAGNFRIRKVTVATGVITTVAGSTKGNSGDGLAATSAQLKYPQGVALDAAGNIYIADFSGHKIRKVDAATGLISTVAGQGIAGYNGNEVATSALLSFPTSVALDGAGGLYIAEYGNQMVRKVTLATGIITNVVNNGSFAGTSGSIGDGGPATSARVNTPNGVVLDGAGNLYIADSGNNKIRMVAAGTGIISTVVGNEGSLYTPSGVAVDASGNLLIADTNNSLVKKFVGNSTPTVTVLPRGGTYYGSQSVRLTADKPATIYYATDGSYPDAEFSPSFDTTGIVTVSSSLRLIYIAVDAVGNQTIPDVQDYTIQPPDVPEAPAGVSALVGNAQATVSFTAPLERGSAITGYTVTSIPAGGVDSNAGSTGLSHLVTGLTNGVSYTFTVTATNGIGTSAASTASDAVIPYTLPGAPTGVSASPGNAVATVSFTAAASNGRAITGYTVTSTPAGAVDSTPGPGLSHVMIGLTNGVPYTFTVTATNAAGAGPASAATAAVTPRTVPAPPTAPVATAGNAQATVVFGTPTFNGGSAITGYTVTSIPAGGVDSNAGSTSLSHVVTGLTNGVSYTFTVTASNIAGTGAASAATAAVSPVGPPGAPTAAVAMEGNAQVTVNFLAPASTGGSAITGYTVTSNPAGGIDSNAGSTGLSHLVTGLINGTSYTFTVTASNAVGTGAASAATVAVTPAGPPGAPTGAVATAGNAQATVAFLAPASNGGRDITGYTVTSNPAGGIDSNAGSTGLSHLVTGLTNGTSYTFTVTASNSAGTGAASAASVPVTPCTVPGAPTGAAATAGNAQATVTFLAPASNGGSAVTGYTVISNPAGGIDSNAGSTGLSHLVTGLTNGVSYTFTVTASNAAGTGAASGTTSAVTPITVPGAPTGAVATAGNAQATVVFLAPASNGGSAVTGYTVTSIPAGGVDSNAGSTGLSHLVTGLTNGVSYTFTVTASNAAGTGAASGATAAVTPITVPGAPTGVTATAGDTTATVVFLAPASNGGSAVTGYTVTSIPAGGVDSNAGSTGLSHLVTGLTNGVSYTFTVTATNAAGAGAASSASNSVTPSTFYSLTLSFAGAPGGGSVNGGMSCVSGGTCAPVGFAQNSVVTLIATPDANSLFTGWTGCTSVSGSTCSVTVSAAKTVTATFSAVAKLKIKNGTTYGTLATAYAAAADNAVIQAREVEFSDGDWILNRTPLNIYLVGGYDTLFSGTPGWTVQKGKLLIRNGTLRVDGLIVR